MRNNSFIAVLGQDDQLPGKRTIRTQGMGSWVDPFVGLEVMVKKITPSLTGITFRLDNIGPFLQMSKSVGL